MLHCFIESAKAKDSASARPGNKNYNGEFDTVQEHLISKIGVFCFSYYMVNLHKVACTLYHALKSFSGFLIVDAFLTQLVALGHREFIVCCSNNLCIFI